MQKMKFWNEDGLMSIDQMPLFWALYGWRRGLVGGKRKERYDAERERERERGRENSVVMFAMEWRTLEAASLYSSCD